MAWAQAPACSSFELGVPGHWPADSPHTGSFPGTQGYTLPVPQEDGFFVLLFFKRKHRYLLQFHSWKEARIWISKVKITTGKKKKTSAGQTRAQTRRPYLSFLISSKTSDWKWHQPWCCPLSLSWEQSTLHCKEGPCLWVRLRNKKSLLLVRPRCLSG